MAAEIVKAFPENRDQILGKSAREQILAVAEDLIEQVGTNGFSYQHIADRVGIKKASIHHHFPTKVDLIMEIGETKSEQFFRRMNEIMVARKTSAEKIDEYFGLFEENFIRGCGASISFFGMLGAELGSQDDRVAARVRMFFNENVSRLTAVVAEGREDGSLRFPGEPALMAVALFSMLEGAMIIIRASGKPEEYAHIIGQLREMIIAK